jgi:DNA-binding beta-propeller fold protein YncE
MRLPRFRRSALLLSALAIAACTDSNDAPLAENSVTEASRSGGNAAVAVASNSTSGNALLVFSRNHDGTLAPPVSYPTGGTGSGSGLGNQGGIAEVDGGFILVVNAGSNDVTVFRREGNRLVVTDRQASGGIQPLSIAVSGRLVYVLNGGGNGGLAGFYLGARGNLVPLPRSARPLTGDAVGPAEVSFSPDGRVLMVTEKNTNQLALYDVRPFGYLSQPRAVTSAGQTPFGFAFDRAGRVFVSEAFGGATDASALSSYDINRLGRVRTISGSVPTTETAACWVAVTPDGKFVYATNTGSASVTGYRIGRGGQVTRLNEDGVTGQTGLTPIDLAITNSGRLLYTLNAGAHTISGFSIEHGGSLTALGELGTLPVGANGMLAW